MDLPRLCPQCPWHNDELIARSRELGKDILLILENISITKQGEYEGPVFKQLHNWLLDPNRTIDVLKSAEGPLWQKEFSNIGYPSICLSGLTIRCALYLWFLATEALAARRPILQGPWEYAARLIVKFRKSYRNSITNMDTSISDRLNVWIIHMMGDCKLCPCPYLRLDFMDIFGEFGIVYPSLETRAFDAVMLSCVPLKRDQTRNALYNKDNNASLWSIKVAFNKFTAEFLQTYDHKLSAKLLSQASLMLHDVSCSYGFHQNRDTGSFEVNIITALFQTISMHVRNILQDIREDIFNSYVYDVTDTLPTIVTAFKKSCETPQLIDVTASCIMDVVEMVVLYTISILCYIEHRDVRFLDSTEETLWVLCGGNTDRNIADTPLGQVLNNKYQGRLSNIMYKIIEKGLYFRDYPMIRNLLYHD